jgi:hypothetical protein
MEPSRFDHLTRQLARHASRRTTARALVALSAGLLATRLGAGRARAIPGDYCHGLGEPCISDMVCCSKTCLNPGPGGRCQCADPGRPCQSDSDCCRGSCQGGQCPQPERNNNNPGSGGQNTHSCTRVYDLCEKDRDCCSGLCRAPHEGELFCCRGRGEPCESHDECCVGRCSEWDATCSQCGEIGFRCNTDADCCGWPCSSQGICGCSAAGAPCSDGGCCSGVCRGGTCGCGDLGDPCRQPSDCCTQSCAETERGLQCFCGQQGQPCRAPGDCCTGYSCRNGQCYCGHRGEPCSSDGDCCDYHPCRNGQCFCAGKDEPCSSNSECCSRLCASESSTCGS